MRPKGNQAVSLVTTLLVIVVLSTVVVAFLQSTSLDRMTAKSTKNVLQAELSARATEMITGLQRNGEAAQFGVASAAFFRAIDATRAVGGAGSGGRVGTPADASPASRNRAPERRR